MKNILPPKVSESASNVTAQLVKYKLLLFVLFIAGVYGFLVLTISTLSTMEPTPEQISERSSPIKSAKVDKKIIRQLQQLQDNSVSVKALFDEARVNPFQEN